MRAVGEKLFSEKLFSKLGCLREVVLEKPFCAKPFASRPGNCSLRSHSARRCSASPYVLREGILDSSASKRRDSRFVCAVRASRWWEVVLQEVVLQARLMKTLAKVGATSNSLWWAINGVSLPFAAPNATQRCARTHIQTWFCWAWAWSNEGKSWDLRYEVGSEKTPKVIR